MGFIHVQAKMGLWLLFYDPVMAPWVQDPWWLLRSAHVNLRRTEKEIGNEKDDRVISANVCVAGLSCGITACNALEYGAAASSP